MKIAVCIKRVPDTEMRFAVGADGKSLDPAGLKYDLSDFDGYAVEVALRQVEARGAGEVVAISLGPDAVQETLRKALSMGAHRAVHLLAPAVPADPLSIAHALRAELAAGAYDLILFGRMATDSAGGAVGPMTATLLNLPCVTSITHLELGSDRGVAHRAIEGATEVVEFPLPAVLTIDEGIARARLPSLKGIMAAKKKPIEVKPTEPPAPRVSVEKLEPPPERAPGRIVGEGPDAVPELVRLLQTEAKVL